MPLVTSVLHNSNAYVATGSAHGAKHWGVTSKGVIWLSIWDVSSIRFFTSADGGRTWAYVTGSTTWDGGISHMGAVSWHIDALDRIHVLYEWSSTAYDGRTYQVQTDTRIMTLTSDHRQIATNTPNYSFLGRDYYHNVDIVTVTMPDGIRYVHLVSSYNWAGDNRQFVVYSRLRMDPDDSYVIEVSVVALHDVSGATGGTAHCKPSIMFRHSGDYKTPQIVDGVPKPDVMIVYSLSGDLRCIEIPWDTSGQTYGPWSAPLTLDAIYYNYGGNTGANSYMLYEQHRWQRLMYSPTDSKWVLAGSFINTGLTAQESNVYERAADDRGVAWTKYNMGTLLYTGDAAMTPNGDLWLSGTYVGSWAPPSSITNHWRVSRHIGDRLITTQMAQVAGDSNVLNVSTNEARCDMLQCPTPETGILTVITDGSAAPFPVRLSRVPLSGTSVVDAGGVAVSEVERLHLDDGEFVAEQEHVRVGW